MIKTFVISPGELDGIGLEVTLKALKTIYQNHKTISEAYIFFADKKNLETHFKLLNLSLALDLKLCTDLSTNLDPGFYFLETHKSPFECFEKATDFCYKNAEHAALVTGPLRKSAFEKHKALGHTDYFRKRFKNQFFMTFFGEHYSSLLLSDHIPIEQVSGLDFKNLLNKALEVLKPFKPSKKIGLLGLNPHAGEDGLIGSVDKNVHSLFVEKNKDLVSGPYSADGFFSLQDYQKFSFLIANYHDQALIPFKLIHGFNGAQASLGLPFVRTSVNHGTGDALYLQNKADSRSMVYAIKLAKQLLDLKQTR